MSTRETHSRLTPSQQAAFDSLSAALPTGNVFVLQSKPGRGKTTVLAELHRALGGARITLQDFVEAIQQGHPLALEDALFRTIFDALQREECVLVDDLNVATNVMHRCHFYPRSGLLDSPMNVLTSYAVEAGKRLILVTDGTAVAPVHERATTHEIGSYSVADYRALCDAFLGAEQAGQLDLEKVFRFAPKLNAHQLRGACGWQRGRPQVVTDEFIEYLRSRRLASNVELGEVTKVDLRDLRGIDDVIQSLEANVVLPLENDLLAAELDLKAKRGVLLLGQPGTGKTTVGRALAHRLKGKFFLIDGTVVSGTEHFYDQIHSVFQAAKDNAPCIIFIDDSDVLFESGEEHGLYRYLLTMLDGLESASVGRVCVMMTAMDVGNMPPALIRSGRVELWLQMRLPDEQSREEILRQQMGVLPASLQGLEVARLAAATEEFSGADLKRTIEDGKALYAFARASGHELRPVTDYFLAAVDTVRTHKQQYMAAEERARFHRPSRPPWFSVSGM